MHGIKQPNQRETDQNGDRRHGGTAAEYAVPGVLQMRVPPAIRRTGSGRNQIQMQHSVSRKLSRYWNLTRGSATVYEMSVASMATM